MIRVKVKFFAGIKNDIGLEDIELETEKDSTIDDILKLLISKYKGRAENALLTRDKKSYKFLIFVNDKRVSNLKEFKLKDGNSIYFMPPVAGG